jgi:hypothetical protein
MRSPGEIRRIIETRLSNYLERDRTGIRKDLLKLFLKIRELTIAEIYSVLARRFAVTYHAIASMVGIIASRLGILHVRRSPDGTISTYELREEYVDIVRRIVKAA